MRRCCILRGASGDAILLTSIKLVTTLLGFVVTRLLSEYLTVYDYGTYSQILLVVSTTATLTILGMVDGANFFFCGERNPEKRDAYISTLYTLQCVISAVAGCLVLVLSNPLCAYFDNPQIRRLLIFAAMLPLLQNLLSMTHVLLVAVGKARIMAVRNLIVSLVRLAAVLLVVMVVQDVAVILLTTVLLDIAQVIFFYVVLARSGCCIRFKQFAPGLVRRIFHYCAPMAVYTIVSALNRDLDKYLIALATDTETLAVYANASKVLPFDIIMASFCTVLVPPTTRLIAGKCYAEAAELYKVFLEIAYISTAILCCAALAAAPQLLQLLYSEKYMSGLLVFCVYILVDLLRFSGFTYILAAAGKTRFIMGVGIAALAINAILNVVFFQWLGVPGPAVATFVVTLGLGVTILTSGAHELRTTMSGIFDLKFLVLFAAEGVVLTILLREVRQWMEGIGLHYLAVLLLTTGAYGGIMLLLHGKRLIGSLKSVNKISSQGGGEIE